MPNPQLLEQPEHGHYLACSERMISIDKFCRRLCGYTFFSGWIMIVLTWFTIRFGFISLLPDYLGKDTDFVPNMVQTIIISVMTILSFLSVYRFKICSVLLFFIYLAMFFFSWSSLHWTSVFSIVISIIGVLLSFESFSVCSDYKQLSKNEGFPLFCSRLAYQDENVLYDSPYNDEVYHSASYSATGSQQMDTVTLTPPEDSRMDEI